MAGATHVASGLCLERSSDTMAISGAVLAIQRCSVCLQEERESFARLLLGERGFKDRVPGETP